MPASMFTRISAICAAATLTVLSAAAPAAAAAAAADRTAEINGGRMTFIDDGDVFKICDLLKNGKGVYGAVFYNSYWDTSGYKRVMTISDGGDPGCDKKGYNIGNSGTYTFVICEGRYPTRPIVTHPCDDSGEFNE
ncbi:MULTISPECIES: hypothetical protein [unclassified Nocardiopsis]|uniref:hypothetical protein n=2 Tax=Nocardiopsidaceae TaxID=83676 RepID=UPI00387B4B27